MSTETRYHIQITREETEGDASQTAAGIKGGTSYSREVLSIRVDEDPSQAIMRLLSAQKRGPRKKNATEGKKSAGTEGK